MTVVESNTKPEKPDLVPRPVAHVQDADIDPDTECGLGRCKPDCIQPCGTMMWFTVFLALLNFISHSYLTYYNAIVTQVERRFGLSSAVMGFLKNVDNIGFASTVLFVSHFGRHANKPVVFALSTMLSGVAVFMFAMPHFVYGTGNIQNMALVELNLNKTLVAPPSSKNTELCSALNDSTVDKCSSDTDSLQVYSYNRGALALFMLSEFLQGVCATPRASLGVTYMDDNARKDLPKRYGQ
jgi:hypothetical protein